jgi:hypothetical protein
MGRSSEETKLSKRIRDALDKKGVWWIRIQSGKIPMRHKGFMWCAENGTPDLWTKWGFLEVKDLSKLSDEQLAWHAKAKREGVNVTVVHSPSEAFDAIEQWKKEDNKMGEDNMSDDIETIRIAARDVMTATKNLVASEAWTEYVTATRAFRAAIGAPETDVSLPLVADCPVPVTLTEPTEANEPPGKYDSYDNEAIDAITRAALNQITTEDAALTVGKLAKLTELGTKQLAKSLKRIGALTVGENRSKRYYLTNNTTEVEAQ